MCADKTSDPARHDTAISDEVLHYIIEEVDEAREVRELVRQLLPHLPLGSFDDLVRAAGKSGVINFRGHKFDIKQFARMIPGSIFPIDDAQTLVALAHEAVRLAPRTIRYPASDVENAARRLRRLGIMSPSIGVLGPPLGPSAFNVGSAPHSFYSHKHSSEHKE